ncbi:MAG TPA: glycoside hydrolase family 15 protein [Gemmatimonadaceae bacterium]|nr:glycoside hydrolase family 15 protein [Gemmatimonadaceae bacterium]
MIVRRLLGLMVLCSVLAEPAALCAQNAPGGPGEMPSWTPASKDGIGTSLTAQSKVWFTLGGGILTEVYYPRVDQADARGLELAVSDGKRVWIESRDMRHAIERVDTKALLFRQTSRDPAGRFTITKTYATDPDHNTLLIDVTFSGAPGLSLYALYHPALENTGYGNTGFTESGALVAQKTDVASALVASGGFAETSSGFAGVNDGYRDLLLHHRLTLHYAHADSGNVVQVARIARPSHFTLALGFGTTPAEARESARASLARGFAAVRTAYASGWHTYLRGLRTVSARYREQFDLAAMVVRAHEDKTYRGAIIASMSIPWGFAVSSDKANVGGYHLVWARDLYEAATSLMVAGDSATARRALRYLFDVQQKSDGSFPQNSWLDGRPYWPGQQMDEDSYPIVLAWQLGITDHDTWTKHIRPAAEYVVAHGPATQQERWEEVGGYSPSTIAAEIAGMVCASAIAQANRADADAKRYMDTADDWASHLESWLVTTTGHLSPSPSRGYYMRIDNNQDPNDGYKLDVHNGGGTWDERDVVDQGFIELVRLGIRPARDTIIENSLKVIDATIRVQTPNGPDFYRYNHDGYGETWFGGPWLGEGVGRLWPIFAGERGEYEVARGGDPTPYLEAMMHFANDGGMIPEQVWDRSNPGNTDFEFGEGTGSATPLVWSMGQFMRLVVDAQEKRIVEQPSIVAEHFLKNVANR